MNPEKNQTPKEIYLTMYYARLYRDDYEDDREMINGAYFHTAIINDECVLFADRDIEHDRFFKDPYSLLDPIVISIVNEYLSEDGEKDFQGLKEELEDMDAGCKIIDLDVKEEYILFSLENRKGIVKVFKLFKEIILIE